MSDCRTIVIASAGTLGDHLPYIALGQRLAGRGHRVRLAVNPALHEQVRAAGLSAVACGSPMGKDRAHAAAADWDDLLPDQPSVAIRLQGLQSFFAREVPRCIAELRSACNDADLLVCGFQLLDVAPRVSRQLDLPWVAASVMPVLHVAGGARQVGQRSGLASLFQHEIAQMQASLDAGHPVAPNHGRVGALLGFSRWILPPSATLGADAEPTGFWFSDVAGEATPQQATSMAEVLQFLQGHPAPLVLTFSSLPLVQAPHVLALHVRAARLLGRGLVVQRGWAGFCEDMLPAQLRGADLLFTDFIAQDALFAQAGAVVHHGGIGTLARALLHGCPMLVEPYGNDQFFNARLVLELGVGAAAHPKKITADSLAELLDRRVLTAQSQARAQALGARLRQEDGPGTAVAQIEAWLAALPPRRSATTQTPSPARSINPV